MNGNLFPTGISYALTLSLTLVLGFAACDRQEDRGPQVVVPVLPKDEVLLPADSSKRASIVEQTVEYVSAPVMEPVAGKIAYDETRTARVSVPIAGRIISAIPALAPLSRLMNH